MASEIASLLEHRTIHTNGVELHVVLAGPGDGTPVVLLHGFPEFWFGWRHQIDALVAAGLRLIIPDQRGYNISAKPRPVRAYGLDMVSADVVGLLDALDVPRAHLVGHDWGAAVAWWTAARYPERLHTATVLNAPHPAAMRDLLRRNTRQLRKSWYLFFFQLPRLPEALLGAGGAQRLARLVRASSRPGTFDETAMGAYLEAWRQPGALRSMINWYRASLRSGARLADPRVTVPVRIIWGRQDFALEFEAAQRSLDYCVQGELIPIDDATHWVQHEAAQRVNDLILEFVTREPGADRSR